MTMVIDQQSRHYGGSMYDGGNTMYSSQMGGQPQFNDPWGNPATSSYQPMQKHEARPTGISMPYSHIPTSAPMASGTYFSDANPTSDVLSSLQDIPRTTYGNEHQYSAPTTTASTYASAYPSNISYAQSLHQQQQQQQQHRKLADPSDSRSATAGFNELDASRGMLALSHQNLQDMTPRNIYEARAQRESTGSGYGFPHPASAHSSISAESGRSYPYYSGSSVASVTDSATDYSSTASDYDPMPMSRTLPRPQQLLGTSLNVPAPQSMMSQFSSKMSSNTQKKHKCKVCDKRFTRPSSLQTHMYSHTGEKPFACDVDGCGRHFSVVSNLRRHKKVHKGELGSTSSDGED